MWITLVNDDPFGNNVRVTDSNNGDSECFRGPIGAHGEASFECVENGAGFGNIITYQDNNKGVGRSFLHDGDRVSL